MSLKLPNDKIVYNLHEQVGVNAENIKYLAEVYKEIDSIPAQYAELKADYEDNIKSYFDDTMKPTFTTWTNTFNGWTTTLDTYLASMSSAAVGAIAGQNIAPANITSSGNLTANSIIENMSGYSAAITAATDLEKTKIYVGAVKNGNKLTVVATVKIKRIDTVSNVRAITRFYFPNDVVSKLYTTQIGGYAVLGFPTITAISVNDASNQKNLKIRIDKETDGITFKVSQTDLNTLTLNEDYFVRVEQTFLLSPSLI